MRVFSKMVYSDVYDAYKIIFPIVKGMHSDAFLFGQTFTLNTSDNIPVLYCRPSPLQTFPRKICNIPDLPPEDLQHSRPSPKGGGEVCNIAVLPRGKICNIEDLPPFFVKFRILIFEWTENTFWVLYKVFIYCLFKYVTVNDKTIIFSYVFSFSIKLRQVIWIPITVKMIWGKLCNGGRSAMVFQNHCRSSGEGLQYNTGIE